MFLSHFASLVCISIGITSSSIGVKVCAITAGIKKYESIMKKKKQKHNEQVLFAKLKLNNIKS